MTSPAERLAVPPLRLEPSTPAALTRAEDDFPTVVPKPRPLTRDEDERVQRFRALLCDLRERGVFLRTLPLDLRDALALDRALDVAGTDRDRLGDHMVHEYKVRCQAERDRDAAAREARDMHAALDQLLTWLTPLLEWAAPQLGTAPTPTDVLAAVPREIPR